MDLRSLFRAQPTHPVRSHKKLNPVIGPCRYCEKPVTKLGGSIDSDQLARHTTCWKVICWSQTRSVLVTENFLGIVTYLATHLGPSDRNALRPIVQSIPQQPSWANIIAFLRLVIPLVQTSSLPEAQRTALIAHLNAYRSRLLKSGLHPL